MKDEQLLQNNRLIAEFMGNKWIGDDWLGDRPFDNVMREPNGHLTNATYNKYWDDLMEVIEKIEDTKTIGQRCYIDISPYKISGYCSGVLEKDLNVFSKTVEGRYFNNTDKLNTAFEIVVELIKWYNNAKKII